MAKTGRPTVMTEVVLAKLEAAFSCACSDEEACLYAGISVDALYDYQKLNPDFTKRKAMLKDTPSMMAKMNLAKKLAKGDHQTSQWWLERKNKKEFSLKGPLEDGDGKLFDSIEINIKGGSSN